MKKNFYRTETFDKKHLHFGGIIFPSDYSTDYRRKDNTNGSFIAARIESDFQKEKNLLSKTKEAEVKQHG